MTSVAAFVFVVRDLDHALAVYEVGLGFIRTSTVEQVPRLGARRVKLRAGACEVELVEPYDDTKPPGLFLRERGEGVFAMTIGVDDPGRARERLERSGVAVVGAPGGGALPPAPGFIRPRDAHGVLIEVTAAPVAGQP
jgi:glyoxalase/bleomycin resistance protein/dioxygenase superfamily protein